jgi:hypothetical protein
MQIVLKTYLSPCDILDFIQLCLKFSEVRYSQAFIQNEKVGEMKD